MNRELEEALERRVDLVEYETLKPRIRDRVLAQEVRILRTVIPFGTSTTFLTPLMPSEGPRRTLKSVPKTYQWVMALSNNSQRRGCSAW